MLALIKSEESLKSRRKHVYAECGVVLKMPALHIYVNVRGGMKESTVRHRVNKAVKLLERYHVSRVCFQIGFSHRNEFYKRGVSEITKTALYESLACKVSELIRGEGETACFFAKRCNSEGLKILTALCNRYRYVCAEINQNSEDMFSQLRGELGVSVIGSFRAERLKDCSVAFFMGHRDTVTSLPDGCIVYAVSDEMLETVSGGCAVTDLKLRIPERISRELPDGFDANLLLSEAILKSVIMSSELELYGVELQNK